jgi:hypothetical protein
MSLGDRRDAVERGFDCTMAAAGIAVPAEMRTGTLNVYRDLLRMAQLARDATRPAEAEPAAVFSLDAILRPGAPPHSNG